MPCSLRNRPFASCSISQGPQDAGPGQSAEHPSACPPGASQESTGSLSVAWRMFLEGPSGCFFLLRWRGHCICCRIMCPNLAQGSCSHAHSIGRNRTNSHIFTYEQKDIYIQDKNNSTCHVTLHRMSYCTARNQSLQCVSSTCAL